MDKNPIQALNEHCQKVKISAPEYQFNQISVNPSIWGAKCIIGEFQAEAQSATKQEAKAQAASNLTTILKYEQIWWEQLFAPRKQIFIDKSDYKPGPHPKVWQPRN